MLSDLNNNKSNIEVITMVQMFVDKRKLNKIVTVMNASWTSLVLINICDRKANTKFRHVQTPLDVLSSMTK